MDPVEPCPAPCPTGFNLRFIEAPAAATLSDAIRWTIVTAESEPSIPIGIHHSSDIAWIWFADEKWAGIGFAPNGHVRVSLGADWLGPGVDPPIKGWHTRSLRVTLTPSEPTKIFVAELRAEWTRYACVREHAAFSAQTEDGIAVQGDDCSVTIEVLLKEPNKWVPYALSVFGGNLMAEPTSSVSISDHSLESSPRLGMTSVENPSSIALVFDITLPRSEPARLDVFDVQGRRVASQVLEHPAPVQQRILVPARGLAAGVFWVRLAQGREQVTAKVVHAP
jgi:hypothetical protein